MSSKGFLSRPIMLITIIINNIKKLDKHLKLQYTCSIFYFNTQIHLRAALKMLENHLGFPKTLLKPFIYFKKKFNLKLRFINF